MFVFNEKVHGGHFVRRVNDGVVRWKMRKIHSGFEVTGFVRGAPGRFEVFRAKAPERVLAGGWQSWSPFRPVMTGSYRFSYPGEDWVYRDTPESHCGNILSDYFLAWENALVGFLSSRIAHPFFTIENGEIVGWLDYFDAHFEDWVPMETMVLIENESVPLMLELYAGMVAQELSPTFIKRFPVGWSSWYHYFLNLNWAEIEKNLRLSKEFPIEVFQIDDGYESDIGDWLDVKPGFPDHPEMAGAISSHGLRPGIWTAPFSVSPTSKLFHEHPDWVVRRDGEPVVAYRNWGSDIYALDLSNPDVLRWLFETFRALRNAGYEFFKIDFLFAGGIPGRRSTGVTPIQAFRAGMKTIRAAVGDSFVLGCGSPLLPAVGYVDGMRIGPDTTPFWGDDRPDNGRPAAKYALRNAITRYFMHRRWWLNDPDCLLLRNTETELTMEQRELYAYTVGVLDNMVLLSDALDLVDDEGRRILERTLKLRDGNPVVHNVMSEDGRYLITSSGTLSGNIELKVDLNDVTYELQTEGYRHLRVRTLRRDGRNFHFFEEE